MTRNLKSTLAVVCVIAILAAGTFAWEQIISHTNEFIGEKDGTTLHDDFDPNTGKKDVYVENTGSSTIFVRLKLNEAMDLTNNKWRPGAGDWTTHIYGASAENCGQGNAAGKLFHDYFKWTMGGWKYYKPSDGSKGLVQDTKVYTEADYNAGTAGKTSDAQIIKIGQYLEMAPEAQKAFVGWIYDADGYAYWSQPLDKGEVTGLLLSKVTPGANLKGTEYYYAIDVTVEAVDINDLPMWTQGAEPVNGGNKHPQATENGKEVINVIAGISNGSGTDLGGTEPPVEPPVDPPVTPSVWEKDEFAFTLDTQYTSDAFFGADNLNVILNIGENGGNNFTINWGDGKVTTVPPNADKATFDAARSHTYSEPGVYTVVIKGKLAGGIKFYSGKSSTGGENRLTAVLAPLLKQDSNDMGYIFAYCSNLKEIPEDIFHNNPHITKIAWAFMDCSNLAGPISERLFEKNTKVADYGFLSIFRNCSGLTGSIPENLFANNPLADSFNSTFQGCTGLTGQIPENLFVKNTQVEQFTRVFSGCKGLSGSIPEKLFEKNMKAFSFSFAFEDCSGLTGSIPKGLFARNWNASLFSETFKNCSGLEGDIPDKLFENNYSAYSFEGLFSGCENLTGISGDPQNLFSYTIAATPIANFNNTFLNCKGITTDIPELWASYTKAYHENTFRGCTNAANYAKIPADWK